MTILDCLTSPKLYITQNWCGGKIIKFQQSQALTSQFESFLSIVSWNMTKILFLGSQCITRKPQIHLVPRIGDLWSRKIWTPKSAQGNVRCKDSKKSNNTL